MGTEKEKEFGETLAWVAGEEPGGRLLGTMEGVVEDLREGKSVGSVFMFKLGDGWFRCF